MILLAILLGFQVTLCSGAETNDVFLPQPKVKTLEPRTTTPTPVAMMEKDLWGLRLWQVAGLSFLATTVSITFCCCLCDCRIPKTGYDKEDKPKDESDDEPAGASGPHPNRKSFTKDANGSDSHKSQLWTAQKPKTSTGPRMGEENMAFDSREGISVLQNGSKRGVPGITVSRQP